MIVRTGFFLGCATAPLFRGSLFTTRSLKSAAACRDELLTSCGTPLANLTAVAQAIRDRFGSSPFIYTNEDGRAFDPPVNASGLCAASLRCAADGERRDCCLAGGVPPVIDAISLDGKCSRSLGVFFRSLKESGCTAYKLDDSEADRVFEYLRRVVYPRLHPHQNVWVVPGLFGSVANNSVDEMLVSKLDRYWAMSINDSRVVGVRHGCFLICVHACRQPVNNMAPIAD